MRKQNIINVAFPFECPFNDGALCRLLDASADISASLTDGLICDDPDIAPAACPLILADHVVTLVKKG